MQINQYANTAIEITDKDWFDMDKFIGAGLYQSQKFGLLLLLDTLNEYLPTPENFALNDLTLSGDRFHDFSDNSMTWDSVNVFQASATVTPGAGLSNFQFDGNGLTASDTSFRITSEGNTTFESYGDNSARFYGDLKIDEHLGVGTSPDPGARIYVLEAGALNGISMSTSAGIAGYFNSSAYRAIEAIGSQYGAVVQNTSGSIAYIGSSNYGLFGQGSTYGLYGDSPTGIGGMFTTTSGYAIKTDGKVSHVSLPTTNAGLATGDAYISDAATILANGDFILAIKA